jgi:hypothetical protein
MVQASLSDQQTTAQITQKALANRSLFQASWKSLLGFLAVLFGALTRVTPYRCAPVVSLAVHCLRRAVAQPRRGDAGRAGQAGGSL